MNSNSTTFTQNAAECISLSFLSYYSKFSLLLCSECRIALFSDTFSSHVKFHYKQHAEKEKQQELLSKISSFSLYTASETFALMQHLSVTLFAFSELNIHKMHFLAIYVIKFCWIKKTWRDIVQKIIQVILNILLLLAF